MTVDTAAIRSSVSVPSLFERDGHKLRQSSDHSVCLCPFHKEKSPSCHVWSDHWTCFGCNAQGDAIEYMRKTRSLSFVEAVAMLGGQQWSESRVQPRPAKVEQPEPTPDFSQLALEWTAAVNEEQMNDFAATLGVHTEPLWWLGVGRGSVKVKEKDRPVWSFPMRDARQKVIGIRLRADDGFKFAVKGSRQGLFIPSIDPDRRALVCEGPSDTAACLSLGFYAIGRPNANACVHDVIEFLALHRRIREVVLVTDNDRAGLAGAQALREQLPVLSWELLMAPKDIRRYVQIGGGRQLIESMLDNQTPMKGKGRTHS